MTNPDNASTPAVVVPPPNTELEVLALDARRRRARIEATLAAMSERLERARANVEGYQERLEALDVKVRRHRWPIIAACVVAGVVAGRRRRRPQVLLLPAGAEPSARAASPAGSALRAAVGAFASYFAKRAVERLLSPR